MMKKKFTVGFENELIIVDPITQIPINYAPNGHILSYEIIKILRLDYADVIQKGLIVPELDACQIEIINNGGKDTIEEAIDELSNLYEIVEGVVKSLWYAIGSNVVPNQDFISIHSNAKIHYSDIHALLKVHNIEKSTNIAWLHCNIWSKNSDKLLNLHQFVSKRVYDLLEEQSYEKLYMSPQRFEHYLNVVNVMNMEYLPKFPSHNEKLTDFYCNDNNQPKASYELVRLKKIVASNLLISELRTPDAGTSIIDLDAKMRNVYDFILMS